MYFNRLWWWDCNRTQEQYWGSNWDSTQLSGGFCVEVHLFWQVFTRKLASCITVQSVHEVNQCLHMSTIHRKTKKSRELTSFYHISKLFTEQSNVGVIAPNINLYSVSFFYFFFRIYILLLCRRKQMQLHILMICFVSGTYYSSTLLGFCANCSRLWAAPKIG